MEKRTLDDLLNELNREDREKFKYLLNFYSREHVFYNFEHYKHALSDFKPFVYEGFVIYVDDKIKQLVSRIDLRDVCFYLESFKTNYSTINRQNVDDLLLYLAMHTTQKEGTLNKIVARLPKYKKMIEEGWIKESDILASIKEAYEEELAVNVDNDELIDLENIDRRLIQKLLAKMSKEANRYAVYAACNEMEPHKFTFVLSPAVASRLETNDIKDAFKKDGNILTKDISILAVKAILGKKFKFTDLSVIEQMKASLRNYDIKKITEEELRFLGDNAGKQTEEVFYLKNIASDPNALRAFSELPENLKEQMLKFNVVVDKTDVHAVLAALDEMETQRLEKLRLMRRRNRRRPIQNLMRNISKLPDEKIKEFLSGINIDEIDVFKPEIGIDPEITMGVEIEVFGFKLNSLVELRKYNELFTAVRRNRDIGTSLIGWGVDFEASVENGEGLEISTPVMRDNKYYWNDLKGGCDFLNNLNAFPTNECGLHVHIGADYLGTDEIAWRNLFEIWKEAESFMYKTGNISNEEPRSGSLEYASPTAPIIDDMLKNGLVVINSEADVKKLADEYSRRYIDGKTYPGRTKSMNLQCIAEGKQNTIEFRIPNGTINPVEIQRTVTLFAKIVEVSKKMSEDKEYKKDIFEQFKNEKDKDKKVLAFLDLVFDDVNTKAIFLDRYFGKTDKLLLGGKDYDEIIKGNVKRSADVKFEWRGYR